jgi:hypothetical protein
MQKIDFIKNLEIVVDKLRSKEIVAQFNNGFANPTVAYNYSTINPLLFSSKSNYDQIKTEDGFAQILNAIQAEQVYTELNLSSLTTILRDATAPNVLTRKNSVALYNFHNSLVQTLQLAENVLQSQDISENLENEGQNGIIIFQVVIDGEGLETEKYIKIFNAINEIVTVIASIVQETEKSEIILLDSGSDTNIGVKAGIETAKSLFLIFKEIWDFVTNFKFYKQKQKNQALLESLTIRTEIQKKVEDGVLTEAEAKEYIHMIKTRTDDLIGMKVLPKQIVIESNQIENRKLLKEFEGTKLLGQGE